MKITLSEHPKWLEEFIDEIAVFEKKILEGNCFGQMIEGELDIITFRQVMIDFYPLVENFPKYMALVLSKVPMEDTEEAKMARSWLIQNLNIERLHADWYRDWIWGFGVPRERTQGEVFPKPEVDAVNNFLWKVCTYGTLAESIAGLNFAIEGPTGEWSKAVYKNIRKYEGVEGVILDRKSLMWLKAHAKYDDHHPEEALEIIKAFATTEDEQERVKRAIRNGMSYYAIAAEASYNSGSRGDFAKVA